MMEWANFYSGASRGLATILNYADIEEDFELLDHENRSKDSRRAEQVFANQSQRQIAPEFEDYEQLAYR